MTGTVPLPGVAVTATNTLTGKKYATTTDVDGTYAMTIPRTGRYVVRAELAAFAPLTSEVRITAEAADQTAAFTLELASRAEKKANAADATTAAIASALGRGTQSLRVTGDSSLADASAGAGSAAVPSLGGIGDSSAQDSIAVSGVGGQTNGLANLSEDQVRDRIADAMQRARDSGLATSDQINAAASLLGGLVAQGGGGGRGPGGGAGRGGGRGGGGFRGFNPTQPHGSVFYQGSYSALDARAYSISGVPEPKPNSYTNRYGVSFVGSPEIPGLLKASSKQFVFFNITGQRNVAPQNFYGTVPTLAERGQIQNADGSFSNTNADFSQLVQLVNGVPIQTPLYDPTTGLPFANNQVPTGAAGAQTVAADQITPQARALEQYYPLPNVPGVTTRNYQNVTTQGNNTTNASARYIRNFGAAPAFGGGRRGGGGGTSGAPPTLRQNINEQFAYSHTASDLRNIIPILGGKTFSNGYSFNTGYSVGYGRLNNNFSINWNRAHSLTTNFFTNLPFDPATAAGVNIPSRQASLISPDFYNGVPNIQITNFTSLSEVQPKDLINQTVAYSDAVTYGHGKHNYRLGFDIRRVHADQIGGNNVEGTFVFSGLITESPAAQAATFNNLPQSTQQAPSGAGFADFLLGQPQETKIQAGLYKTYLRENVYDWYVQDDWRARPGLSFNYGLRYEYFGPYYEKNNRLVNLANPLTTNPAIVTPNQPGFPRSLVNPDRLLYSPRVGVAYKPKFVKDTVIRGGYGINYNTGQYAVFAQSLSFQPPFAITQNNVLQSVQNQTGCVMTSAATATGGATTTNLTLANGFAKPGTISGANPYGQPCSVKAIQNTYAVDKNYRLGHVQVYNIDIQHTFPHGTVMNISYNGSKGGNLDIVDSPNTTATAVITPNAQAFTYETSVAESRQNQGVITVRKRLERGFSIEAVYQYSHSIDNSSSIGGSTVSQVQNSQRLDLEEGNSSFDVRHQLTGDFLYELPFGPNRAFFNEGGRMAKILDGFGISGTATLATGTYVTPQYTASAAQIAAGGTYTLRPDRVFSQPIHGPHNKQQWFNPAAFTAPANGFGTASRNSIEGPGTIAYNMALSRTFNFGGTKSFEGRVQANNVFNIVDFNGIDTTLNSATFGQVTSAGTMRQMTFLGRYRF